MIGRKGCTHHSTLLSKPSYPIATQLDVVTEGIAKHQKELTQRIVIKGFFTNSTNLFLVSADGILIGHKEQ